MVKLAIIVIVGELLLGWSFCDLDQRLAESPRPESSAIVALDSPSPKPVIGTGEISTPTQARVVKKPIYLIAETQDVYVIYIGSQLNRPTP